MTKEIPGLVNAVRSGFVPHDIFNKIHKFRFLAGNVLVVEDCVDNGPHIRVEIRRLGEDFPQVVDPGVLFVLPLVALKLKTSC